MGSGSACAGERARLGKGKKVPKVLFTMPKVKLPVYLKVSKYAQMQTDIEFKNYFFYFQHTCMDRRIDIV